MKEALESHDRVIRNEVEARDGVVFKHTGDGALAAFGSAVAALEAAAGIQRRIRDVSHPDIGPLRLRMAVHTGEVEERDGDYFGPPLNRTARLMSIARGGQTLVSLVTERLASSGFDPSLQLRDLGEYRLKDLARPEQVFQLDIEGLPNEFPPPATPDLVPNNLPTQTTSFVGRERDLAEVAGLLQDAPLVTITGVGGAGKTRLALQTAADVAEKFPDGSWLVELAAITDPSLIDVAAADALGTAQAAEQSVRRSLIDFLTDKALLLILDNCEHLIDGAAEFVDDLLSHGPAIRILATSRELLGVSGEVAYGLRSLSLPSQPDLPSASELMSHDAVRLFLERAQAAKPGFQLDDQTSPAVAEICRRLDGMPLALELAAARLRSFSPQQIADNLDQRFRLLTGGRRTAVPRQQTLAAAIDWSYRLLDEPERRLFQRLSVFQGGFTLEAVSQVCTDEKLEESQIWDLLPALVDKSLVAADVGPEAARYRLLETLRQFARDLLEESGRADEFRLRHALFYRDLAQEAGKHIRGPYEITWWLRIDTELDNLRQAMVSAMESDRPDIALETTTGFWRFWWFKGRWSEGVSWMERTLAVASSDIPKSVRATGLLALGSLLEGTDRHLEAIEHLREATRLYTELEQEGVDNSALHSGYAASFINLSVAVQQAGGDEKEVTDLNRQALDVGRRIGDDAAVAVALGNLAESAAIAGELDESRTLFEEALAASSALGSRQRLIDLHHQIGLMELTMGSVNRAREAFEESLDMGREADLEDWVLIVQVQLAMCDLADGADDASERLEEAMARAVENPDIWLHPFGRQMLISYRCYLEATSGDLDTAAKLLGAAMATEERGSPPDWTFQKRLERVEEILRTEVDAAHLQDSLDEGYKLDDNQITRMILGLT